MNGNHSSKDLIPIPDETDDREDEEYRTIYCGNLTSKIDEELLYELFLQAGPVDKVRIPTDKDGRPHSYGFVTFVDRCSVPYALSLFEDVTLHNARLNLRPRKMDVYRKMPQSSVPVGPPSKRIKLDNTPAESTGRSSTNDHYKSESLRGRWASKSDRDYLKPNYRRNNDRRRNNNNHRY